MHIASTSVKRQGTCTSCDTQWILPKGVFFPPPNHKEGEVAIKSYSEMNKKIPVSNKLNAQQDL